MSSDKGSFGPFQPGLKPGERIAELRAWQGMALRLTDPDTGLNPFLDSLIRVEMAVRASLKAEASEAEMAQARVERCTAAALAAFDAVPSLPRRRMLALATDLGRRRWSVRGADAAQPG